jgi:HSP20 family protein
MLIRRRFDWPTWTWRNPFAEMEALRREMERIFDEISEESFWSPVAGVFPMVNITEDKENFYVRAELPGVDVNTIDISITGNTLSIEGERKPYEDQEKVRYHRRERETGSFKRLISIPGDIDPNRVEANAKNGILTIILPKSERAKPKQIPVRTS